MLPLSTLKSNTLSLCHVRPATREPGPFATDLDYCSSFYFLLVVLLATLFPATQVRFTYVT